MWDFLPGKSLPRPVTISKELYDAIKRFSNDKKVSIPAIFEIAFSRIWRQWTGGKITIQPANLEAEHQITQLFIDNPCPGKLDRKYRIYIGFHGEKLYQFACELDNLYITRGTEDLVRRTITWFLKEQRYLEENEEIVIGG